MSVVSYWSRCIAPFIRARLAKTERGASLVEYALLVALIAVICIAAVSFLGNSTSTALSSAAGNI